MSSDWWSDEISSREAEAAGNTVSSPSSDSDSGGSSYYDERTGQTFISAAVAASEGYGPGSKATDTTVTFPVVTPDGSIFYTSQEQYWMDPDYRGIEPSYAEKQKFSDAQLGYYVAGTIAEKYVGSGAEVSPFIQALNDNFIVTNGKTVQKTAKQILLEQNKLPENDLVQSADDLIRQFYDKANQAGAWLADNLLIVVIVIAAIVILPKAIRTATGGR